MEFDQAHDLWCPLPGQNLGSQVHQLAAALGGFPGESGSEGSLVHPQGITSLCHLVVNTSPTPAWLAEVQLVRKLIKCHHLHTQPV